MNRILLSIILILGSLWAVKPVPKLEKTSENKNVVQIQILSEKKEDSEEQNNNITEIKESKNQNNKNDQFIDVDSNNVNDQRENDLLKIKQLKTKIKDIFKKDKKDQKTPKDQVKTK